MNNTVLITGANRGLGLELVRQYAHDKWQVIACCRAPQKADQLNALTANNDHITIHQLDLSDLKQIPKLASTINKPIDLLINNAGVFGGKNQSFGNVSVEDLQSTFLINTIAPLKMCEAFIDHVAQSKLKTIACLTSKMGSIGDNISGGRYIYRASKSALNMIMKSLSIDVQPQGVKVIVLHPGWVQTDMGGPNALINMPESITNLKKVIANKPKLGELTFYDYQGNSLNW